MRNIRGATLDGGWLSKGTWWVEVHYMRECGHEARLSLTFLKVWFDVYWTRRKHYDGQMRWWTYGLTWQPAPSNMTYKILFSGCFHRATFETAFFRRKSSWKSS